MREGSIVLVLDHHEFVMRFKAKRIKLLHYPPNEASKIKTYYKHPVLDRITGRYTAEWDTPNGLQRITAHTRLQDFEGNFPSFSSIISLPTILKSYVAQKFQTILKDPVPFLVIDAIRFLETIIKPGMNVLEVGGGNSTGWFLNKGVNLITVEDSEKWAELILRHVRERKVPAKHGSFKLELKKDKEVISFITALPDQSLDLVLVDCADGAQRSQCVRVARPKIVTGGWMVLDNTDHPYQWLSVAFMSDCRRIRFVGYVAMGLSVCQTSFWRI